MNCPPYISESHIYKTITTEVNYEKKKSCNWHIKRSRIKWCQKWDCMMSEVGLHGVRGGIAWCQRWDCMMSVVQLFGQFKLFMNESLILKWKSYNLLVTEMTSFHEELRIMDTRSMAIPLPSSFWNPLCWGQSLKESTVHLEWLEHFWDHEN